MRPNPHATDVWRAIVDPHDSDVDSDITSDGKQLIAREHQRQPWCRLRLKLACTVFWVALILLAVTWVLSHSWERTYYASAPPAGAVNYQRSTTATAATSADARGELLFAGCLSMATTLA